MKCNFANNQPPLDCNLFLTTDTIFNLPRPHNGQIAYATDTETTYVYNDGWKVLPKEVKIENNSGLKMSLYDLNVSIMNQLHKIDDVEAAMDKIDAYREAHSNNKYFMLYGKEISYFTIFSIQKYAECDTLGEAVIECLNNVGEIKSIDLDENGNAIECWVTIDDESTCLYLFPYDDGIVSVKE